MVSPRLLIRAETVNVAAVVESASTTPEDQLRKVAEPAVGVVTAVLVVVATVGATDRNPKPNAETTTSAKRLKLSFLTLFSFH